MKKNRIDILRRLLLVPLVALVWIGLLPVQLLLLLWSLAGNALRALWEETVPVFTAKYL